MTAIYDQHSLAWVAFASIADQQISALSARPKIVCDSVKLPTLPKHMRSLQVFRIIRVAQSLALCVVLVHPFGNPIIF
jgi:hypothetical protein